MKVWAGDPPGGSHLSNDLACLNDLPLLDADARQVCIEGLQTQAMLDEDAIAVEKVLSRVNDDATSWCRYWCAGVSSDVYPSMWTTGLIIEKTPQSERTGENAINWQQKVIACEQALAVRALDCCKAGVVSFDALQVQWCRIDLVVILDDDALLLVGMRIDVEGIGSRLTISAQDID